MVPSTNLQEGEEEWAELMKRSHGEKGADWYAKGVKTVEVSLAQRSWSDSRINGSYYLPSSRSKVL